MSWPLIILTILIGLALVALEIVALPGFICGIFGAVLAIIGIWQSYANYGTTAGIITFIISIVIGVIMLVFLMKTGTWKKFSLNEESDGKTNQIDSNKIAVGSCGTTISRLAPAGKAEINGEIVEVHADGEFIDQNTPIKVTEIEGYKILVNKQINN